MLKTFSKGGVHPPQNKLSATAAIEKLSLPETVTILVSQHIGAPAKILVGRKDKVKVGQLIAESGGFISTNIHSSVSGTVMKIVNISDVTGYKKQAIVIKVEGDEWSELVNTNPDLRTDIVLSSDEIVKRVLKSGIVGLGGAAFPSHVKLLVPNGKTAEILLINGVECEPYLTSDHVLMLEKSEEIMVGISILMKAINVKMASIGIENNKQDAIQVLTKLAPKYPGIKVVPLKVQYPQGSEKHLIKAIINREVPSGALPIEVGAVVLNIGTVYAVYEAVQKNKPLIEKVVTVTGKSIKKPSNFLVRIGTPISNLIEAAGGLPDDTGKIIAGGPMMGKAIGKIDIPVVKATSGILLMPENEAKREDALSCIRCAKCVSNCPMGLEPYLLMTLAEKQFHEKAEENHVMDCIECGSCSFTCPSKRPLTDYIRLEKNRVGGIIRQRRQK